MGRTHKDGNRLLSNSISSVKPPSRTSIPSGECILDALDPESLEVEVKSSLEGRIDVGGVSTFDHLSLRGCVDGPLRTSSMPREPRCESRSPRSE